MGREPGIMLWTAETWTRDEECYQTWVAEYTDGVGVGRTIPDALHSLADALEQPVYEDSMKIAEADMVDIRDRLDEAWQDADEDA